MMKKTTLALTISAATLAAAPAFATNGDHLIGLGAKSRALGGTGIATFYGAESALVNPALLAKGKGNEVTFAGTVFRPSVSVKQTNAGPGNTSDTSDADTSVIPEVAIMNPINDQLTFGIGIFGVAGMGVDYRDNNFLNNARSNLQLMKFAPSLAFNGGNWGIGASLAVMYGSLDISYKLRAQATASDGTNTIAAGTAGYGTTVDFTTGNYVNYAQQGGTAGVSDDYGFGWQIGGYFDVTSNLTLGAMYQSAISMSYKGQIKKAAADFGLSNIITSDTLEQPAVLGAGLSYRLDSLMLTGDFKQIKWGDAKGYKQFGWEDQNVIALGARYMGEGYWIGLGFNKADNPIKKFSVGNTPTLTNFQNGALNRLNYLMFPGTVEQHWTLGGGYRFSKSFSVDVAVTYAPEVSDTVSNASVNDGNGNGAFDAATEYGVINLQTKHSQVGYTVSLRYDF